MTKTTIHLLGPFELRPVGAIRLSRKTAAILAWLAAMPREHDRRRLQSIFLQQADDPQRALRWHLSQLRRVLGAGRLQTPGDRVALDATQVSTDLASFERALSGALDERPEAELTSAVALYRDEFLSGLTLDDAPDFDLWTLGERARLRQLYEHGLEALITRRLAADDAAAALGHAQRLVASNPLLETAHARLMELYARTGQRAAALQQYETCRQLLRRELDVEPTPELSALHARLRAGRDDGPRVAAAHPALIGADRSGRPGFVGRTAEVDQLNDAWRNAARGSGSVVWIEAAAGGGKTRLLEEAAARFDPAPLRLTGRGYESTRSLPLRPWIEILEARLEPLSDETLRALPAYWVDPLSRLLPALAQRLGRPQPVGERNIDWSEHLRALAECLVRAPTRQPLLIVLDDLQWLDTLSLQLFHGVASLAPRHTVLLAGLLRSEEGEPTEALRALRQDLARAPGLQVHLAPLAPAAVAALVAERWRALPTGRRPDAAQRLLLATGGNPLFVTETLDALSELNAWPERLPLTLTLNGVLTRRLDLLPESGRQVLEALAILGGPSTEAQLEPVSGRSEAEIVAALDAGLRFKLVSTVGEGGPARYDFAHDLFREAALARLTEVRRRLLHRRAATHFAQRAGRLPPGERRPLAGPLLRHARAGDATRQVLDWAPVAAHHALRLGAYAEALAAYAAAADAAEQLRAAGVLTSEETERRRLEAELGRCEALYGLGRATLADLALAADLVTRQPDPSLRARFHLYRAVVLSFDSYGAAYAEGLRAEAFARRAEEPGLIAECLVFVGRMQLSLGATGAGIELIDEALRLYRAIPDPESVGACLSTLAWALLDSGRVSDALRRLEEARPLVEASGDPVRRSTHALVLAIAWNNVYDNRRVRAQAEEALRICLESGRENGVPRARFYIGVSAWIEGDWARARAISEQVWQEAHGLGDAWQAGWAAQLAGRCALCSGELADADAWLGRAFEIRSSQSEAQNVVSDLSWLARLRLVQGRPAEALAYSNEAIQRLAALQVGTRVWEQQDVFMVHAEALRAVGAAEESTAFVRRAQATLLDFLGHVGDPVLREQVLAAPANARILMAARALPPA